ncbi:MAG: hypothetical protein CEO40_61, partial [Parcubacteria group bacterium LiPW_72]
MDNLNKKTAFLIKGGVNLYIVPALGPIELGILEFPKNSF